MAEVPPHEPIKEGPQPSLRPPQKFMVREVLAMAKVPPHEPIEEGL